MNLTHLIIVDILESVADNIDFSNCSQTSWAVLRKYTCVVLCCNIYLWLLLHLFWSKFWVRGSWVTCISSLYWGAWPITKEDGERLMVRSTRSPCSTSDSFGFAKYVVWAGLMSYFEFKLLAKFNIAFAFLFFFRNNAYFEFHVLMYYCFRLTSHERRRL